MDERTLNFTQFTNKDLDKKDGKRMVSVMQLKDGLTRSQPTFMVVLLEDLDVDHLRLHEFVSKVLDEFAHLILDELPKMLHPRGAIGHQIEWVPGAEPPV